MIQNRLKFAALLAAACLLPACASSYVDQSGLWAQPSKVATAKGVFLPAADFLGAEILQSPLHSVDPQAYNDGFANSYLITSDNATFVVQGTDNARARVLEIAATEKLREKTTVHAIGNALGERGVNLVETPIRAFNGGRDQVSDVSGWKEAGLLVPAGLGNVIKGLAGGIKELGVTGLRITRGAAGTKCSGVGGCVSKASSDVWSGVNSIVGKHEAARRAHASVGTDPYGDNPVLNREVDRISYAEAWTGTSFKLGVTRAGIPFLSGYTSDVGYYNNAEFVSQYEDADRRKNAEIATLQSWGASVEITDRLYNNAAYSPVQRTYMLEALSALGAPQYRVSFLDDASQAPNRFAAQGKLKIAQYFAALASSGEVTGFVENTSLALAISRDGALIMPFVADYLRWSDQIAAPLRDYAALRAPSANLGKAPELHVLGRADPEFVRRAQSIGLNVIQITPS